MHESNATLKEAFRHHAWATRTLLTFCAELPPEQMLQPPPVPLAGDHGSILETFDHIVCTDGGLIGSLTGQRPAWAHERGLSSDLGELSPWVDEAEALWMDVLSIPEEGARKVFLDDDTYEVDAAIVMAQALHHGSAHREQISAILRGLGLEPPEVQPWDFADATGRSRWIKPD
ncbi:MAG TPA: DinB family protein [Candidatus Dormibacteraeota bacterium]|nr:DinB family protein [Candidatus Dormibacteraeota bacterium]